MAKNRWSGLEQEEFGDKEAGIELTFCRCSRALCFNFNMGGFGPDDIAAQQQS